MTFPVLIAEDDDAYQMILERAFRDIGLKTQPWRVFDGKQAMAYLQGIGQYASRRIYPFPKLLLVDLKMPGTDGFDVLRFLQRNPHCRVLPTLVLTSSELESDMRLAYELGADGYFVKPATPALLREMLAEACDLWGLSLGSPGFAE